MRDLRTFAHDPVARPCLVLIVAVALLAFINLGALPFCADESIAVFCLSEPEPWRIDCRIEYPTFHEPRLAESDGSACRRLGVQWWRTAVRG